MHGVQAIAKAAPATTGPPRPARCISAPTWNSRFRRVTNGAATKKTPIATISTAETFSSVSRWSLSVAPTAVAPSPSRMKIVEKLSTNSRLGTSTRRAPPAARACSGVTPATAEM